MQPNSDPPQGILDADRSQGAPDTGSGGRHATPATPLEQLLRVRLQRRHWMAGGLAWAAMPAGCGLALAGCGGGSADTASPAPPTDPVDPTGASGLTFQALDKSTDDRLQVPAGYTATVLLALGDPIAPGVAAHRNDGTDTGFEGRIGDSHDGMAYFGLSAQGQPDPAHSGRALLVINHEYVNPVFLFAGGPSPRPRPAAESDLEMAAQGVSIVEIARDAAGRFAPVIDSRFNRRITARTEIEVSGPARGHRLLVSRFSPDGTRARGTVNNCGTGKTPWGTVLTGEENWAGYFRRAAGDPARRGAAQDLALLRYGSVATATVGAASRHGWETSGTEDHYACWDTSVTGRSVDGSDDHRHAINAQGYMTEIDPYDPAAPIKKRTALGRLAHESAAFGAPVVGQPLVVYMGDDAPNEYLYKFVSESLWQVEDAQAADRMAVGDKYLDRGRLYAARFLPDGRGEWLALSMTNAAVAAHPGYPFTDDGDVAVHARLAADAAGATPMDRPEWCDVHPTTGEVYFSLTNNSHRRLGTISSTQVHPDAANPRVYTDVRNDGSSRTGNPNGHIIRLKEAAGQAQATGFQWDIYLFGAEAGADPGRINLSLLTAQQDFSSPDGLVFTPSTGLCWVLTDDSAYTDVSNSMMLASVAGAVGDGGPRTVDHGSEGSITTLVGRQPTEATLKRFLVGPVGQEITGLCETPDGQVLFVNVQHPGGDTPVADIGDATRYQSHWPGNAGYGAGGALARPRSATVMITRDGGGRIGI